LILIDLSLSIIAHIVHVMWAIYSHVWILKNDDDFELKFGFLVKTCGV